MVNRRLLSPQTLQAVQFVNVTGHYFGKYHGENALSTNKTLCLRGRGISGERKTPPSPFPHPRHTRFRLYPFLVLSMYAVSCVGVPAGVPTKDSPAITNYSIVLLGFERYLNAESARKPIESRATPQLRRKPKAFTGTKLPGPVVFLFDGANFSTWCVRHRKRPPGPAPSPKVRGGQRVYLKLPQLARAGVILNNIAANGPIHTLMQAPRS
ncbi:hypothetical protein GWI33_009025 [Rhynchophorus ferrugineus]|uniref:Uncharacterized protein n=1 Tax=Rhynchophorus ferrugineus TaxID=354439 RepID=A0A834MDR1_RHYFE|nr:hypothetical protein GWI33_009025 [Rhynchophorus ferrugineus]